MSSTTSKRSDRTAKNRSVKTSKDLVKSVSKQMKYYFEIRRQEDGFDLSGPDCPRPHYPALKSRPMLLYEGLHDKSVKHFFSDNQTKAHITHMNTGSSLAPESKKVKKLMRKEMDRVTFAPKPLLNFLEEAYGGKLDGAPYEPAPWMGVGMHGKTSEYTKNSEKYPNGTFGGWKKQDRVNKRGYGNPEPTLKSAFKGDRRVLRSTVPGWIDNKECSRLVNEASKILSTSEMKYLKLFSSRPQTASSYRSSRSQTTQQSVRSLRPRSASPQYSDSSPRIRDQKAISYQQAKHDFVKSHEEEKTRENLRKGKYYYDIDGRRHPVKHQVKNSDGYLDRSSSPTKTRDSDDSVPDWLRDQMRSQDVEEKKMPYNKNVQHVDVPEKDTAKGEDSSRRVGVRKRPKSAKITKTARTPEHDDITLSDGSYEEVNLDDMESEDEYVEDKACQTGWELFVQYDQSEHILPSDQPQSDYRVIVRTGSTIGASTKALINIILYGNRGRTQEMLLEKCDNHIIPFQQGAEDIFAIRCSSVGNLKQIQIGHDSTSIGDAWFLDSVTIEDLHSEQVYEFLCDQWMSSRSEDKLTKRILQNTAIRKLECADRNTETEDGTDKVIEDVARTNSHLETDDESVKKSSSTRELDTLSTSHLNNSEVSQSSKPVILQTGSDTSSTYRFTTESTNTQPPKTSQTNNINSIQIREGRNKKPPVIPEDFESDVTNPSVKHSGSVKSERTRDDESECQTAVFGEGSLTVRSPRSEADSQKEFMEGFKAGQMAAAQAQRDREERERIEEEKKHETIVRGQSIHSAAKSGNTARVNAILDANMEMKDAIDDRGNSALHLAVSQGHADIVKILASRGAFLQLRNQAGYEAMHLGALNGHIKCMNILHAMGASINTKTDDHKTPLHLAAMNDNVETSKWLISNRCELEPEDEFGRTALDVAINFNHSKIEDLIRECMSDNSPMKQLRSSKSVEWEDDRKESVRTERAESDEDPDGSSIADLRQAREREDLIERKKSYEHMKQKQETSNMSFLDLIRAEAENENS